MFGPPGRLYVYLSYGLHHCANIVTEADGVAGAVLLRAAAVQEGEAVVRARRLAAPARGAAAGWRSRAAPPAGAAPAARRLARDSLLRGPGNLCRGLGLTLRDNGVDVCAGAGRLAVLSPEFPLASVGAGPRVGISAALDHPLRFFWASHPAVSRG